MKISKTEWFGIGAGLFIAAGSVLLFFGSNVLLMYFLLVVSLIVASIPFMISLISLQNKEKEIEEKFLVFTRDLVESVRAGAPVSRSIVNLRRRNYGVLTQHVQKLANQLSIGIPLNKALQVFSRDTKSKVISRAVGLISEAERAGGKIETILASVLKSVNQIEILKKERKAAIANLVTQGYIIFIVFIVIMLVLEFKILPIVSDLSGTSSGLDLGGASRVSADVNFARPLFVVLLVQSFFAGLVIGKISEGSVKNGIKHSFILIVITLLVVTGARAFFGGV
jgi:flagellar protein FlaJ|tara:strand:+ start:2366 stop:3211 length:846 start_codon:yes stop_codon:yes gene_type:complete